MHTQCNKLGPKLQLASKVLGSNSLTVHEADLSLFSVSASFHQVTWLSLRYLIYTAKSSIWARCLSTSKTTGHTQVWCRLGDTVIVVWSAILRISRSEGFVKECGTLSNCAIYTASEFTIRISQNIVAATSRTSFQKVPVQLLADLSTYTHAKVCTHTDKLCALLKYLFQWKTHTNEAQLLSLKTPWHWAWCFILIKSTALPFAKLLKGKKNTLLSFSV